MASALRIDFEGNAGTEMLLESIEINDRSPVFSIQGVAKYCLLPNIPPGNGIFLQRRYWSPVPSAKGLICSTENPVRTAGGIGSMYRVFSGYPASVLGLYQCLDVYDSDHLSGGGSAFQRAYFITISLNSTAFSMSSPILSLPKRTK